MRRTEAFPEPNHTQTPNNFFEMVPEMQESELRVTLIMIRNTFGWHRDGFRMSVTKLAKAAGLSRQGTLDGAAAAEKRGTFIRANRGQEGEAEWSLAVALQPVEGVDDDPSTELREPLQSVEDTPLLDTARSPVKESKENKEKGEEAEYRNKKHPGFIALQAAAEQIWPLETSRWQEVKATLLRSEIVMQDHQITVSGLGMKAAMYQDSYAKSFERALVGVLDHATEVVFHE